MTTKPKALRCALYTRKSSDEGLDQAFNSLDAQREACAAYVASQTHEGWQLIRTHFDDGGYSGGSMDRPALQHLLAEIAAGKGDIVVVYKIDRLTRSLADFARMVELFDKHGVSFVSVTQSFNTTSSMGRLTLNVLLSFAQFEREVTGERIRDKIAASKAKGMWMGGVPPLGYDIPNAGSRTLNVNKSEAEAVRLIFRQYLKLGSVRLLEDWLKDEGYTSKQFTSAAGNTTGGIPFNRGALYHLLRNSIYLGMIRHKGVLHPGQHPPIVDDALFGEVQHMLDANRRRHAEKQTARKAANPDAPLTGRIYDAVGQPMSPTASTGKLGKRYRYYVSTPLQKGSSSWLGVGAAAEIIRRISAETLEQQLTPLLTRLVPGHRSDPLSLPTRIEVHANSVHLVLPKSACPGIQARLTSDERIEDDVTNPTALRLIAAVRIRNRRGRTEIRSSASRTSMKDPVLIGALQRAHAMIDLDARHLPVCRKSPATQYGRRLLALAFLAPDLQRAILDGTQPADLTLDHLMAKPLPAEWTAQRQLFDHI
jgi:DNA invertase Pin-like site-specific DNA recombinase